jgi:hypothetical protein
MAENNFFEDFFKQTMTGKVEHQHEFIDGHCTICNKTIWQIMKEEGKL